MSDAVVEEFIKGLRAGDPRAVEAGDRLLAAMADVRSLRRPLSEREEEILALIAAGLTEPEISQRLHLSRDTVKDHMTRVREALGATSTSNAVWLWTNEKWVTELRAILAGEVPNDVDD